MLIQFFIITINIVLINAAESFKGEDSARITDIGQYDNSQQSYSESSTDLYEEQYYYYTESEYDNCGLPDYNPATFKIPRGIKLLEKNTLLIEKKKKLGKGGFGTVYRARNKRNNEYYAVKLLNISSSNSDNRAVNEIVCLHVLAGKENIIQFNGAEFNSPWLTIAFELMDNDLSKELRNNPYMDILDAFEIVKQVIAGAKQMHEARIVHLDFKPMNILVKRESSGKKIYRISDFGLCDYYGIPIKSGAGTTQYL